MLRTQRLMLVLVLAAIALIAAVPSSALAGGTGECPTTLTTRTVSPSAAHKLNDHEVSVEVIGFVAYSSPESSASGGAGETYEWGRGKEGEGEEYVLICGHVPFAEAGATSELFEMIVASENSLLLCPPVSPATYSWQAYDL